MANIYGLGPRYDLSPATLAQLADIAGAKPPPDQEQAAYDATKGAIDTGVSAVKGLAKAYEGSALDRANQAVGKAVLGGARALGETQTGVVKAVGDAVAPQEFGPPKSLASPPGAPTPPPDEESPDVQRAGELGASFAPGRVVPGHWQDRAWQGSVTHGFTPAELDPYAKRMDSALEHERRAGEAELNQAKRAGIADATYEQAHAAATEKYVTDRANLNAARKQYIDAHVSKMNQLAAENNQTFDEKAYWKEKGTLGSILGALAIGLGQFGASMTGGPNTAMEIIKNGIDRNINGQIRRAEMARGKMDIENNLYLANMDAWGDKDKAILQTRADYLENVKAQLNATLAKENLGDAEKMRAEKMMAMLEKESAGVRMQLANAMHSQFTEQSSKAYVPPHMEGGAAPKRPGFLVTMTNGTTVQMPNQDTQNEAIKKFQVIGRLQRMNNEILKTRQNVREWLKHPLENAEKIAAARLSLKDMGEQKSALMSLSLGQGTLKEEEYKRAMEFNVGTDSLMPGTDDMLRRQNARWDEDQEDFVKAPSGSIVKKGYAPDASGNLQPTGVYTGQDVQQDPKLSPAGSKAMDPRIDLPTARPPLEQTTPKAPILGGRK